MASNDDKYLHSEQKQSRSPQKKDTAGPQNVFRNDGSFMEMFKRKMEEEKRKKDNNLDENKEQTASVTAAPSSSIPSVESTFDTSRLTQTPVQDKQDANTKTNSGTVSSQKKTSPFVGKRRGNVPVLKTGAVKKQRTQDDEDSNTKRDAWSQYMAEVDKYKSQSCQDEDKTRPLVK